jgi:hypothetical protein
LAFALGILVAECLRIDFDGGNMIKFWLIEHEILDISGILDTRDLLAADSDLLATDSDFPFKELINFTIFDDLTDSEVMKSVIGYRALGL